jgi:nucleoside-diphosphate-sugar epimerase
MTETILVTGGSGKLGRAVLADLRQHGYRVLNADRQPTEGVHTVKTDLCDLGQVYGVASRAGAIVHLAAIPAPGGYPPEVVFQNNVMSTFNILQAASVLGIKKVVLASSLSALGLAYKSHPIDLHYLPIDEAHPALAQDAYGISKIVGEEIADGFARRDPALSLVSLRLPFLANPGQIQAELSEPSPQRLTFGASILWSYLDVRDGAAVVRQALEYQQPGHEILYANAPNTFIDVPTVDLVREHFPGVKFDSARLADRQSPIDCSRARAVLGFDPQYDWRTAGNGEQEKHST